MSKQQKSNFNDQRIQSSLIIGGALFLGTATLSLISNYIYPHKKTNYTTREKRIVQNMYMKMKQLETEMLESNDVKIKMEKLALCQCMVDNILILGLSEQDINTIIKENISQIKQSFFSKQRILKNKSNYVSN